MKEKIKERTEEKAERRAMDEADISRVKRKFLDLPYAKESKSQCLDIYLPGEGEGPFPALIYIHGGGFAMGDRRDHHLEPYLTGVERGFAVVSVEYRLSGEALFPAAVLDCREAVRFVRKHGAEYKIDKNRLAVIGGSAGGNLSALIGMNIPNGAFMGEQENGVYEETPYVQAAVDQFGPIDFKAMDEQARGNGISRADHDEPFSPESKYLGIAVPDAPDELNMAAGPIAYISKRMSPLMVQHGTADRLVPYEQSVELVNAVKKKLGDEAVVFIPLEGADHDDRLFSTEENMELIFDFLRRHV